ncbi:MAG: contractile injection system protein, VgrG/Pvc8 family, partial [Gemmataceae bacterium]
MAHRAIHLKTPLDAELLVSSIEGFEELSQLPRFELEVACASPFAFDQLLGQKVRIDLEIGRHHSYRHGMVTELYLTDSDDYYTHYRLEIVPLVWRLTKRVHSRIFTKKTIPDILEAVFKDYRVKKLLRRKYHARDYVVQYQESDFHFACRLMEEEGIYYYFDN